MSEFLEDVKISSIQKRDSIIPIPDDCVVDKTYLGGLSNKEFIDVFKELQQLIVSMYNDIGKDPSAWGFPEEPKTKGLEYERLTEIIFALMANGEYTDNKVVINTTLFLKPIKSFANIKTTLKTLEKYGFTIDNFNNKNSSFTLSHTNSELLRILHLYENLWDTSLPHWSHYFPSLARFSHRWIEEKSSQKQEMIFLATLDEYSSNYKEIQFWLYEQAKIYGYSIDKKSPREKGCLRYSKGSKGFLLVGERDDTGRKIIFSKTIFRKSFENKEKMDVLYNLFPDTFGANKNSLCHLCNGSRNANDDCSMRISYKLNDNTYKNCAYRSFYFNNLNKDNVKILLDMFVIENKIKPVI